MSHERHAGTPAATALVIASMIGTGVFTSLGFQLNDFHSAPPILLLWVAGGLIALCGALCYAELAASVPRSGGEYHFLGALYHPSLGFMAGVLSALVGFTAPTALTALALGGYVHSSFGGIPARLVAIVVIVLGTLAHAINSRTSARVQVAATSLKLLLVGSFLVAALVLPGHGDIRWWPVTAGDAQDILKPAFATALLYVFYSYSGWNAAVYGLEEWHRPEHTVRRALVAGTLLVLVLYVALNSAFLHAAPMAELKGVLEVGHVAADSLFGKETAKWLSALLAVGLFASISALLWAGPRVLATMGKDVRALRWFAPTGGVPKHALAFQALLAIVLVVIGDFEFLLTYTQIGLTLSTALTVAGVIVLRIRRPDLPRPVKVPLYPLPPLIFLGMTAFVIIQSMVARPLPTTAGLVTAGLFALLWFPLNPKRP